MNNATLLKGLELINTKNKSIQEKEQYKSLFMDYKKYIHKKEVTLKNKDKEIEKLKAELEQKNKKIQSYEENINKLPKILKKLLMNQII